MSVSTLTKPQLEKDDPCLRFVRYMVKSEEQRDEAGVPLSRLVKEFGAPVIAKAFSLELVELGQQPHSWTGPTPGMVVTERDPDTNAVTKEHYEDKRKLHWTKKEAMVFVLLKKHGSKSIKAIVVEDNELPDPLKYHVRLTNDGLAAAA